MLQPGDVEDVVQQGQQRLAGLLQDAQPLGLRLGQGVGGHHLGHAQHAIQRRANLVTHIGQEARLGGVGGLGGVLGGDQRQAPGLHLGQGLGDALHQHRPRNGQNDEADDDPGRDAADQRQPRIVRRPRQRPQPGAVHVGQDGAGPLGRRLIQQGQARQVQVGGQLAREGLVQAAGADHHHGRPVIAGGDPGALRRDRGQGQQIDPVVHAHQSRAGDLAGCAQPSGLTGPARLAADVGDIAGGGGGEGAQAVGSGRLAFPRGIDHLARADDVGQVMAKLLMIVRGEIGVGPGGVHSPADRLIGRVPDRGRGHFPLHPVEGARDGAGGKGRVLGGVGAVDLTRGLQHQGQGAQHRHQHQHGGRADNAEDQPVLPRFQRLW